MAFKIKENPIIKPDDVKPSNNEFVVLCAFNPGVTLFNDEIYLLLRIAETVDNSDSNKIKIPIFDNESRNFKVLTFDKSEVELLDTRGIKFNNKIYLSSISHLRVAKSKDGVNFKICDNPLIYPDNEYEIFGVEDPRITKIGNVYYITYTSVSNYGITVSLAKTYDFKKIEKLGVILPPDNKDVVIFPEKINNKYYMLHRPMNLGLNKPSIWIAESNDLLNWGNHKLLLKPDDNSWDSKRIGAGDVPVLIDEGWLEIYHGVDNKGRYHLGAILLDKNEPTKVIARSKKPILSPEMEYEKNGFYNNVVFSCGSIKKEEKFYVYYGAADKFSCLAILTKKDIFDTF